MYRILKLNEAEESKEYRYITNHGIGPGATPDGTYIRSEDLENGKTAIYLNRPLTDEELKKYDIKPEWIQESTLTEAPEDDLEELKDKAEETLEREEEVEDTIDTEEDQEENPVEEESELDKELDELRSVLVDLDLNLYRIARKEDTNDVIYVIGKVAENSNDVLMLVSNDIQNGDDLETDKPIENTMDNVEKEVVDDIVKESGLNESDEVPYSDEILLDEPKEDDEKPNFDFVKLPNNFDEINKLNPRYGEELTPNHEAIMDYLMNCLIETNPEAAEELQKEKDVEEPVNTEDDKIDLDIDIGEEEEEE